MVELEMMKLGSGVITDLDRFVLGPHSNCDIDGHEIMLDEIGDRYYDEDTKSHWGTTSWQGERVRTQWKDNGHTIYHHGGPCGPSEFDSNGEYC